MLEMKQEDEDEMKRDERACCREEEKEMIEQGDSSTYVSDRGLCITSSIHVGDEGGHSSGKDCTRPSTTLRQARDRNGYRALGMVDRILSRPSGIDRLSPSPSLVGRCK